MKWAWPQKVPRAGERGVIAGEKQSMHPVSPESDSCVEGRQGGDSFVGQEFSHSSLFSASSHTFPYL